MKMDCELQMLKLGEIYNIFLIKILLYILFHIAVHFLLQVPEIHVLPGLEDAGIVGPLP